MAKDNNETEPLSREDLLAVVRELVAANALTADKIIEISQKAAMDAYERGSGKFWDITKFPAISAFNKTGDKAAPRTEVLGEIFWIGYMLQKDELTEQEIGLLNRLESGRYHGGQWAVIDLALGVKGQRKLLVIFPCSDEDQRASLPRSMTEMLTEMVEGVPTPV